MNTVLMSIPVPVTWWSRAQVHSISPLPQARSSIRVPGGGLSAWPKVASLSLVNGLWVRWLLSGMVKLRGRSTSGLLVRDGLWHSGAPAIVPGEGLRVVTRQPGHCPGCAGTGVTNYRSAELLEVNAGLRAANARLRELLAAKDAQIEALTGQLEELRAQVADLAAQARQNPENSSRPPSSDGLGKPAPKSLRKKTGRKPGRPKGQPGATMELTDHPDHVIRHEPLACRTCGTGLAGARETGAERRQVTEIPPVKAEVTEHQMIEMECRAAGSAPRRTLRTG